MTIGNNSTVTASWKSGGTPARLWVLQCQATNKVWTTQILPANQTSHVFAISNLDIISICAVDRAGNLSAPAVLSPQMTQLIPPLQRRKGFETLDWPPKKQN
jgi:hypothetical protein